MKDTMTISELSPEQVKKIKDKQPADPGGETEDTISEGILKLYSELDPIAEAAAKQEGVSCSKGCNHCCYMQTMVTLTEAIPMAQAIFNTDKWMTAVRRLERSAKKAKDASISRADWFLLKRPCPLLDKERGVCSVYSTRPSACRYYYAANDPEECSYSNIDGGVLLLDLTKLEAQVWKFTSEAEGVTVAAPLPITMLYAMKVVAYHRKDQHKFKYLMKTIGSVPTPQEWMVTHLPHLERLNDEAFSPEVKETIAQAGKEAGL